MSNWRNELFCALARRLDSTNGYENLADPRIEELFMERIGNHERATFLAVHGDGKKVVIRANKYVDALFESFMSFMLAYQKAMSESRAWSRIDKEDMGSLSVTEVMNIVSPGMVNVYHFAKKNKSYLAEYEGASHD